MAMPYWRPRKRGRRKPIPKEPGAARSKLANAILQSRRAAGLTQEQLGRRVGLKGRAVYRWERDESVPTKRNRVALVTALTAVKPEIGAWFAQQLETASDAPGQAAPATPAEPNGQEALERAVFALADELDLPPRRARGALKRLFGRLREARLTLDAAESLVEEWARRAE
jgi:transcriptional regulator with XRE-family HTH domain